MRRMKPEVRVYRDLQQLSETATRGIVERITTSLKSQSHCSVVLSGGTTPRSVYELLGTHYRARVPWNRVWLFWGDERNVPQEDLHSNYRLVRETLLARVPIPPENVNPMPTDPSDPDEAARVYEATLRRLFSLPWPRFDLVLLGLGVDGHTASLFPHSQVLDNHGEWVAVAHAPVEPHLRLTLTLPVFNHARCVFFLVSGAEKAEALRGVIFGPSDARVYPASAVRPVGGAVVWWVDSEAAALIPDSARTTNAGRP